MINVLVVDDHAIFRSGLKRLFSDEPDIQVLDEAKSGREALGKIRQQRFDVVLLDINLPERSGLDVLEQIKQEQPKLPVLMLSMYPPEQYSMLALKNGANGYVAKDMESSDLVEAIRQVARGGMYLTSQSTARMLFQNDQAEHPPHYRLSPRELQILMGIVNGDSLTEIGEEMFISVKTVATHRSHILEKLQMTSNAELVRYAMRHRLID